MSLHDERLAGVIPQPRTRGVIQPARVPLLLIRIELMRDLEGLRVSVTLAGIRRAKRLQGVGRPVGQLETVAPVAVILGGRRE